MSRVKILDCTLRDGGYYTNWDFASSFVSGLTSALAQANVDVVELGYRSRKSKGFSGLYRYCVEDMVRPLLPSGEGPEYAFMLDVKEFCQGEGVDADALSRCIRPQSDSIFQWCRLASHASTLEQSLQMAAWLKEREYRTTINLMGISLLSEAQLDAAIKQVDPALIDVFYFADSFGSLMPRETARLIERIRRDYPGLLGVHMHENQGLALANTLTALDMEVDYVDATVTGMGRGAGNLRLEQLLLMLYFRHGRRDLNPTALVRVIQDFLEPMRARHGWGWDFNYMLSGLEQIHPTYCQNLKSEDQYTLEQVASILEAIPPPKRNKFDESELLRASESIVKSLRAHSTGLSVRERYSVRVSDSVLVLAGGPAARAHEEALAAFVERTGAIVLECNDTGLLADVPRTTVVLNDVRLSQLAEHLGTGQSMPRAVVTGATDVPSGLSGCKLFNMPYRLAPDTFAVEQERLILPGYVVGMYALGLALLSRPSTIYLAGFDGFADAEHRAQQVEMERFWSVAEGALGRTRLVSLLPTHYGLDVESVYAFL